MMKSIALTMLTSTMGFAWKSIRAGEHVVEAAGKWGTDDYHASLVERSVLTAGNAITAVGERLELAVNKLALRLGYNDGEVSGMVAWPALAR
jgi:hypothetical protein